VASDGALGTNVAACTLALPPIRDTLIEGFSHFVTSMTTPIVSGWSDCRVGLAPTGKRRLCTAHPDAGAKMGCGVNHFSVRSADFGSKCFWVNRTDGTTEKFSYKACIYG
jgi:hypothetical protein